jgi:hypothetical protein
VFRRMVTLLIVALLMVSVVAVPLAGADTWGEGGAAARANYKPDRGITKYKVYFLVPPRSKYTFRYHGRLDAFGCYQYWNSHGHPGHRIG